ncbi:hypothetical protein BASA81_011262 [Batrachochytrium salamandrivorans]|nr:hypothetical protein BASA81_011262 [Batrachochytrium salamandrivorans]
MNHQAAAVRIQQWYLRRIERMQSSLMIRLLVDDREEEGLHDTLIFLQATLSQAHRLHQSLLALLRARYLTFCQTCAREDISVDTYQNLIEAIVACGRYPVAELQTDHELKCMLETWDREVQSPGYLQAKHEQQLRSNEVKQSVKNGNSDAYLKTMVDKGAFDVGFALQHFAKLRKSSSMDKRKDTPAKQLLRKLSSRRFSISFRNTPTNSTDIQISHHASTLDEDQSAAMDSPVKAAFASPFKRRGSVAFSFASSTLEDELEHVQQHQLPFTEFGETASAAVTTEEVLRQFKMDSQFFYGLVHNSRKDGNGIEVASALAQFLKQTDNIKSVALRTEVFYQLVFDLASRPIRNESDENGEFVLVKHAVEGSDHVLALLCVLLSVCRVPSDFGPYLIAFIVQRLGRDNDPVTEKVLSLIQFDGPELSSSLINRSVGHENEGMLLAKFVQYSTLMPEKPKMQVRKRVLETMRETPSKPAAATAAAVNRQLFVAMLAAEEEQLELEEKEDLPVIAPIRMNDEERELRENFTVCQMMFDFNGEGGEQYMAVSKGDILWLSGLNSSKEWAKVYRREDQRVGWVPLSFVGYPGYE